VKTSIAFTATQYCFAAFRAWPMIPSSFSDVL